MEDCDLEGNECLMQRINLDTHERTHMAMIGHSNCLLFHQKVKNNQIVALRHDHAGCIWFFGSGDENNWQMENKYIYPGFGYILASKRNLKYCIYSSGNNLFLLSKSI